MKLRIIETRFEKDSLFHIEKLANGEWGRFDYIPGPVNTIDEARLICAEMLKPPTINFKVFIHPYP